MNSPKLILAFLRHGEYFQKPDTPSAFQPYGLTPTGFEQAQQAATTLTDFVQQNQLSLHPIIESSNLLRAWQTADALGQKLIESAHFPEYKIQTHLELNERSVGAAANLTVSEIEAIISEDPRFQMPDAGWKSDSLYKLPFDGAESLMEAGERVADKLTQISEQLLPTLSTDTLKIVTGHGAAFRHAAYVLGIMPFDQITQNSMHHARPLFFEITTIGKSDSHWKHLSGQWKTRTQLASHQID